MKIALLGAPGVGKSDLAHALATEYDLKIVDKYVDDLQTDTGLALGPWSSYAELYMVAGVRAVEEAIVRDDRVTVGTIYDTITYATIHADVAIGKSPEYKQYLYENLQRTLGGLTMWAEEAFQYDVAFFLPYTPEQREEIGVSWKTSFDQALPIILETLYAPAVYRLEGDAESRLKIAKEVVELVEDAKQDETAE